MSDNLEKLAAKAGLVSSLDHPASSIAKAFADIDRLRPFGILENAHVIAAREAWAQIDARNKLFEPAGLRSIFENPHIIAAQKAWADLDARKSLMVSTHARLIEEVTRKRDYLQDAIDAVRLPVYDQLQAIPAAFRERFSLPGIDATEHLAGLWSAQQQASNAFMSNVIELQGAMDRMRTPWLDTAMAQRSVRGFAELQSMGKALGSLSPFDDQLARVLRGGLGDWRDPITWRPEIFTDLAAREALYVDRGVDAAVADFTDEALDETLEIAAFKPQVPALVDLYGDPLQPPPAESDGDPERNRQAYDWLFRLETLMRSFIDEQMTRRFGPHWHKHQLSPKVYELWQEKAKKTREAGGQERALIAFADFGEYVDIICRGDNWREVFQPFFGSPESLRESLQRLYPIRNDTMHARPITQIDEIFLYAEVHRLARVLNS